MLSSCRFRDIDTAFTSLDAYMKFLIATRREDLAAERKDSERKDVFRLMLRASEGQGTWSMTDEELVSDVPRPRASTFGVLKILRQETRILC
jgi:cytochrome P450